MSAKRNWLVGCGIGCGLMLLAGIAIPAACVMFFRGTMQDLEQADASREALEEQFGAAEEFVPWPDGTVPADRVEAFLRVREATQPARASLGERFNQLAAAAGEAEKVEQQGVLEKLRFGLGMAKTGMGMAPDIGAFFDTRNAALLEAGMGLGEYTYLYTLSYYALLEHSPDEGPGDKLEQSPVDVDTGINAGSGRVRRELREMLQHQLAALPAEADPHWREALTAEVAALAGERRRLPWQTGLPHALQASLEPYRERLAATYDPATNPLELARNEKRGPFSYTVD
jgi:hypothetical protein